MKGEKGKKRGGGTNSALNKSNNIKLIRNYWHMPQAVTFASFVFLGIVSLCMCRLVLCAFVCPPWYCILSAPWHSLVLCSLLVPLGTVPLCVLLVLYPLYMKHQLTLCVIMSFRIVPLGIVPTHTLTFKENEMKVMIHGTV